jgi:hypothetical protein
MCRDIYATVAAQMIHVVCGVLQKGAATFTKRLVNPIKVPNPLSQTRRLHEELEAPAHIPRATRRLEEWPLKNGMRSPMSASFASGVVARRRRWPTHG